VLRDGHEITLSVRNEQSRFADRPGGNFSGGVCNCPRQSHIYVGGAIARRVNALAGGIINEVVHSLGDCKAVTSFPVCVSMTTISRCGRPQTRDDSLRERDGDIDLCPVGT